MSSESSPKGIAGLLDDPEAARLFAEVLESYRELAKRMGSAAPLIEALSGSFALTSDPNVRAEHDELRKVLVRYLASVDEGEVEVPAGPPHFEASPDISAEALQAFVAMLLSKTGR